MVWNYYPSKRKVLQHQATKLVTVRCEYACHSLIFFIFSTSFFILQYLSFVAELLFSRKLTVPIYEVLKSEVQLIIFPEFSLFSCVVMFLKIWKRSNWLDFFVLSFNNLTSSSKFFLFIFIQMPVVEKIKQVIFVRCSVWIYSFRKLKLGIQCNKFFWKGYTLKPKLLP